MIVKTDFVCLICSRIFKNPISFPCGFTICSGHLNDKEVLKTNTIRCEACNVNYNVKETNFRTNRNIENMLSRLFHLSVEEISLKQQIEQKIAEFYQLYDELREKNSLLERVVTDHFVELRRNIDIRREEAKSRIDALYLEMIDLTKQTEAQYMGHLKKQDKKALSRSENDSLEEEGEKLDEMFRDPNLCIENVKAIKTKHEKEIGELKDKLWIHLVISKDLSTNLGCFAQNIDNFDKMLSKKLDELIKTTRISLKEMRNEAMFRIINEPAEDDYFIRQPSPPHQEDAIELSLNLLLLDSQIENELSLHTHEISSNASQFDSSSTNSNTFLGKTVFKCFNISF